MRLLWRIYLSFLTCTLLALAATTWYANRSLRSFYEEEIATNLLSRASVLALDLKPLISEANWEPIDRHCKEFGRLTQTRVTVILPDGKVVGDSDSDPSGMENHGHRPEIIAALSGQIGRSVRFSDTIRRTLMYLAIPVWRDGALVAVARASLPLSFIEHTVHSVFRQVALGGALVALFFGVVAFYLARRISQPLDDMRRTAERLANGDLQARVALPGSEEMRSLAHTLNQMAAQLHERLETISRQSEQQKAVFASMVEGVLAVDGDGHILDLNAAAARLLNLTPEQARGRSIQEMVRNLDLQQFIMATLAASGPVEGDIVLYSNEERFLQLHGTVLKDSTASRLGALIVLNDITNVKRLETVRRDFVANVSHELKTPITALQGCVETLSDATHRNPEDNERFLAMMRRQVTRLNAIVEDLLSLSRLEHDVQQQRIPLEPGPIAEVLQRAAQSFAQASEAKGIILAVTCPENLSAPINAPLLEQAVGNLIDNAIKYSGERTSVAIRAAQNGNEIEIQVADQGPGIEKRHLDRIFERFYRVDLGRSRALGGTGLGLAIVKHVALAHHGTVAVESTPGQGSIFTIRIPRA
jgi:two-component system phosphate regulon sensor histidine kinase PhoR